MDVIETLLRRKGAVFLSRPPPTRQSIWPRSNGWQAARDAAGLPGLRIHDLRHPAASFMVNSVVDPFAVGKVLGHANVASSARYATCPTIHCSPPPRRERPSKPLDLSPLVRWPSGRWAGRVPLQPLFFGGRCCETSIAKTGDALLHSGRLHSSHRHETQSVIAAHGVARTAADGDKV